MNLEQSSKIYSSNNSIVYNCLYHIIWCTKYRRKVINKEIEKALKTLIIEKQDEYGYKTIEIETMPDHVHILISHNPQASIVQTVGKIKGYTSHVLRNSFPKLKSRIPSLWTRSKFISTCGVVTLEVIKKYIEEQKNR